MFERLNKFSEKQKTFIALGVFALLIAVFYGNTLVNDFTHDDIGQVVQNEYIQSLRHAPRVLTGCIWEFALGGCSTYYRPFQSFSYLITYQFSSHPGLFHAVNLLYFFIVASLVFFLVRRLTQDVLLAFLTGVIFLIHPINNEAVNWISAVPELSFTIFILASTIFYLRYREGIKRPKRRSKKSLTWGGVLASIVKFRLSKFNSFKKVFVQHGALFISAGFYFLALLSKEPAVLLPLVFLFLDFSFLKTKISQLFGVSLIARYTPYVVALGAYITMRFLVLGGLGSGGDYYGVFTRAERVHAFFTLFGQYLLKLVTPYPLVFFYPFEKQSNFGSIPFLVGVVLTIAFFSAFIFFVYKKKAFFALPFVWLFVFLAPVLLSLNSVGENIFSERYLFASSIGFALLVSSGLMYFFGHKNKMIRQSAAALVVLLVVVSGVIIFPRNQVWKNDFSLYAKTIQQNPDALSIRRNYAVELSDRGDHDEAISHLEEIVRREPQWRDINKVYNNFGETYSRKGNPEQALFYFQKFAEVAPGPVQAAKALNNIGAVYFEEGNYLQALTYFCRARYTDPDAPEPQYNMDRVTSILGAVEDKNLHLVYDNVINGGAFEKAEIERIVFKERGCLNDVCVFDFSSSFAPTDIVLPFLIMAAVSDEEAVALRDLAFDPQTGGIEILTPLEFEETPLTFIFPTCDGRYYEVETSQ